MDRGNPPWIWAVLAAAALAVGACGSDSGTEDAGPDGAVIDTPPGDPGGGDPGPGPDLPDPDVPEPDAGDEGGDVGDAGDVPVPDGDAGEPDSDPDVQPEVDPDVPQPDVPEPDLPTIPVCGNGTVEGDEECDEGLANSDELPDACRTDCTNPGCGDGVTDSGEDCDDANENEYDGCTTSCEADAALPVPAYGEVIVSELMINPATTLDPEGEWIELVNLSEGQLNLGGCVLRDEGTDLIPLGDSEGLLLIEAGQALVFAFAGEDGATGIEGALAYGTMLLDNIEDEVILECGEALVDAVAYGAKLFPVASGAAMALDPQSWDADLNDQPASWCASDAPFAGGFGSPGALNPECPEPDITIDACTLVGAGSVEAYQAFPVPLSVDLDEPGVTDLSEGVDVVEGLIVEVGYGNVGSDPATADWTWAATAPEAGWTDPGGVDRWSGGLVVPEVGSVNISGRASKDGGETWVYCEGLATLTTVASPCVPNPCSALPADACLPDQLTLATYPAGACEPLSDTETECTYPATLTDCGATGQLCQGGACGEPVSAPPVPGAVIFSEVMQETLAVPAGLGEWFELYNPLDTPWNLQGCVITDDKDDEHEIEDLLVIPPGGRLVLAREADPALNGGLQVDHEYDVDIELKTPTDTLRLTCGELVIDEVTWGTGWPKLEGVALSLSPFADDAGDNDLSESWCAATVAYGDGDLGTPGTANAPCPGDIVPVDECVVDAPAELSVGAGVSFLVGATVALAGLTDESEGVDEAPWLLMEVGYGPDGTEPGSEGWIWLPTYADETWTNAEGVDHYLAKLKAPSPGTYDVAFRASGDEGNSWTLCDQDGGANGYQIDQAQSLVSEPSACDPDPCGDPGVLQCDGLLLVQTVGVADCAVVDDAPQCAWETELVQDCGLEGGECTDGACVGLPTAPEVAQVVFTELQIAPAEATEEWIELVNVGDTSVTLSGCTLDSGETESWTFETEVPFLFVLSPKERIVLARTDTATPKYAALWEGLALANTADDLGLICGGVVIDAVAWDQASGWPVAFGVPMSLSAHWEGAGANDSPLYWCEAAVAAGTPGSANPVCPAPDAEVESCQLGSPLDASATVGEPLIYQGLVLDLGVTDASSGADPVPGVLAQVGYGPDTSDPLGAGWSWSDATIDTNWDDAGAPGWDRYIATVAAAEPGDFDTAFRLSFDEGQTWILCDIDGSDNGYDPAQAGALSVAAGACFPNPCDAPGAPVCTGDFLEIPEPEGVCTPDGGGGFTCSYPDQVFDCAPYGGCDSGACAAAPAAPSAAGEVLVSEVMRDSLADAPDTGEWVELYNPTGAPLDLAGCELSDEGGQLFVIDSVLPVIIPAGGHLVLAVEADPTLNGGLDPVAMAWGDAFSLSNTFDEVILTCGGTVIDALAWAPSWPGATGAAMQLSSDVTDHLLADDPAAWCVALTSYGDAGNVGSPGQENVTCDGAPQPEPGPEPGPEPEPEAEPEPEPDTASETTPPSGWSAVWIDDTGFGGTCISVNNADGADIDAIGLFDQGGSLVGYLGEVRGDAGDTCPNDYEDFSASLGAPDGTLLENYVSLVGGYLVGEFAGTPSLEASQTITVYEVGAAVGSIDEVYDLYLATDIDCGGIGKPLAACSFLTGSGEGEATFVMPAGAF